MNLILLVLAIICFVIAGLLGFGAFTGAHLLGWLSAGLALFAGSFLVPVAWRREG